MERPQNDFLNQQNELRKSLWEKVRSWWKERWEKVRSWAEELTVSERCAWVFSLLTTAGVVAIAVTELHCSGGYFLQPFVKADGDDLNAKGKLIYYLIILAGAFATLALSLRRHRQTDLERQNTLKKLDQDERKITQDKSLADDKLYAEIYVKAVEQLGKIDGGRRGDTAAVELRIGGLYALESLARNAQKGYKEIVMKVVTAYIRENARRPQRESSSPDAQKEAVALPEDVVVAFRVLNDLAKRFEWKTPIDFEHADFEWVDFARVDFPNCTLNLRFAKLNGANLSGKMMNGADLSSAKLNGANLFGTQLNGANLRDAKVNDTKLSNAQLNRASLNYAELNGADLTLAELNGADLRGARLSGADLSNARLNGANLFGIQLNGAQLIGAFLNGANLSSAQLNGADLIGVQLNGAQLTGAFLNGAIFSKAKLNGAQLKGAWLNGANLRGVQLNGADLSLTRLNVADLRDLSFAALTEEQRGKLRTQLTPFNDRTDVAEFLERLDGELARDDIRPLNNIFCDAEIDSCRPDGLGEPFKDSPSEEDYARNFASRLAPLCTDETIVAAFIKRMQFAQKEVDEFQFQAWQALRSKLGEALPKNTKLWNALSEDERAYLRGGAGGQAAQ